jgi:hypothetical protein
MSVAVIEKLHDIPQFKEVGLCRRQHPDKFPLQIKCSKGNHKSNKSLMLISMCRPFDMYIFCMNVVLSAHQLTERKLVRFNL